ncbi:MAG TPA: hypothetical protein VIL72_02065 [Beijerinckiaceae bacterium]|jgi:hypothetical protein
MQDQLSPDRLRSICANLGVDDADALVLYFGGPFRLDVRDDALQDLAERFYGDLVSVRAKAMAIGTDLDRLQAISTHRQVSPGSGEDRRSALARVLRLNRGSSLSHWQIAAIIRSRARA